jgi:hypothetical protein
VEGRSLLMKQNKYGSLEMIYEDDTENDLDETIEGSDITGSVGDFTIS